MDGQWRYRATSVVGTLLLTLGAVAVANTPTVQRAFSRVPYFGRPAPAVLANGDLTVAVATTLVAIVAAMWPLFKPQPRRILDVALFTQKRVLLAMFGLASLGYYNYTYRLPRPTLMLVTGLLLLALPLMMVAIRRRPRPSKRAVIVGDDRAAMADILAATDDNVIGYVSPPGDVSGSPFADGGFVRERDDPLADLESLGGLSRLDEVLVTNDVDTALLAFSDANHTELFGTLDTCYEHGVVARLHRNHADAVLTDGVPEGDLVDVDLAPWDPQDYVVKRLFDVAFAATGLLVFSPVMACIAVAVKLDSDGPVLYSQERTAEFGDRFRIYKFRSMIPEAEAESGPRLSDEDAGDRDPRVTDVGAVLRRTHLDEIPQLWSILVGDMSVVGPRPERPELDSRMETTAETWRRRWFVRPGLTGLAQINDATGHDPEQKLRYDVEYIRQQSLLFDLKIVIRQIWLVLQELYGFLRQ